MPLNNNAHFNLKAPCSQSFFFIVEAQALVSIHHYQYIYKIALKTYRHIFSLF